LLASSFALSRPPFVFYLNLTGQGSCDPLTKGTSPTEFQLEIRCALGSIGAFVVKAGVTDSFVTRERVDIPKPSTIEIGKSAHRQYQVRHQVPYTLLSGTTMAQSRRALTQLQTFST